MTLTHVADAAYPFDYSLLPADVSVVLGYLGGDTPHVWTPAEVAECQATGRQWCPIWTAPNPGAVLTANGVNADAQAFITELVARRHPMDDPVFYDVEASTWNATGTDARTRVLRWQGVMRGAGYPNAYVYAPWLARTEWGANWVGYRPMSLPAGRVGWQYVNAQPGKPFDLSVFDPSIFGGDMPAQVTDPGIQAILQALGAEYGDPDHPDSNVNIVKGEGTILAAVQALTAAVSANTAALGQLATKADLASLLPSEGLSNAGIAQALVTLAARP